MKLEQVISHLQDMPSGSDVDVRTGANGDRQLVIKPVGDAAPMFLMIHAPNDKPPPEPKPRAKTARKTTRKTASKG